MDAEIEKGLKLISKSDTGGLRDRARDERAERSFISSHAASECGEIRLNVGSAKGLHGG
jgi:hypothetical protein